MNAFDLLMTELVEHFGLHGMEEKTRVALRWWIQDTMGGEPGKFSWWTQFDAWLVSPTEKKKEAAIEFLTRLITVFKEVLGSYYSLPTKEQALAQLVQGFSAETRYKTGPYFEFIEELQHTLWVRVPVVCFIGGHASGDMFGIGASALIKADLGIVVHEYKDKSQDHSEGMKKFFDLVATDRVKLASSFEECFDSGKANSVYALMEKMGKFCWLAGYNMGTYFLMDKFTTEELETENRRIVRSGFKVDGLPSPKIKEFLEHKTQLSLDQLKTRKVVVLWSRFTGKKGEYHPEHDTSFTGMAQLAWLAAEMGCYVIITGDKPIVHQMVKDREKREGKFDAICKAIALRFGGEARCFNLTEFWEDDAWKSFQPTRIMQYQLYELLHRECDVRHLGMRSGNLEALALLSYFVRYMEEGYSWGGQRMKAWHGKGIGYERILLKEPPTRVGKYLHYNQKLNAQGLNKATVSQAFVPKYIRERNRGVKGTSSKSRETVDQEFTRLRSDIRKRLAQASKDRLHGAFNVLDKKRQDQELTQEKPESVQHWYAGFDFSDLMQIVFYFGELNACCKKKLLPLKTNELWGVVPDLRSIEQQLGNQAIIVSEMRGLLVQMGLVRAITV